MRKIFVRFVLALASAVMIASEAYAVENGAVSNNLLELFHGIGSAFSGICVVVGIGLIFAAFIQYRQHKANKLLVPISKPIVLFILGVFLACIPVLGHYTKGGQLITQATDV